MTNDFGFHTESLLWRLAVLLLPGPAHCRCILILFCVIRRPLSFREGSTHVQMSYESSPWVAAWAKLTTAPPMDAPFRAPGNSRPAHTQLRPYDTTNK